MKLLLGLLLYTCSLATADVASDFISNEIVPDALNKAPNQLLSVAYNGKAMTFGEELTPTNTIPQPTIEWNFDASSYYTVMLTDVDPISREKPTYREFLHWLVINIPGDDFSKGETVVEYAGCGPSKDAGFHRELFTLYKQPDKITVDLAFHHNRKLGKRLKFSQKDFSSKYNLGDPIAGNMFVAQYDDYVPQLRTEFMNGVRIDN